MDIRQRCRTSNETSAAVRIPFNQRNAHLSSIVNLCHFRSLSVKMDIIWQFQRKSSLMWFRKRLRLRRTSMMDQNHNSLMTIEVTFLTLAINFAIIFIT